MITFEENFRKSENGTYVNYYKVKKDNKVLLTFEIYEVGDKTAIKIIEVYNLPKEDKEHIKTEILGICKGLDVKYVDMPKPDSSKILKHLVRDLSNTNTQSNKTRRYFIKGNSSNMRTNKRRTKRMRNSGPATLNNLAPFATNDSNNENGNLGHPHPGWGKPSRLPRGINQMFNKQNSKQNSVKRIRTNGRNGRNGTNQRNGRHTNLNSELPKLNNPEQNFEGFNFNNEENHTGR